MNMAPSTIPSHLPMARADPSTSANPRTLVPVYPCAGTRRHQPPHCHLSPAPAAAPASAGALSKAPWGESSRAPGRALSRAMLSVAGRVSDRMACTALLPPRRCPATLRPAGEKRGVRHQKQHARPLQKNPCCIFSDDAGQPEEATGGVTAQQNTRDASSRTVRRIGGPGWGRDFRRRELVGGRGPTPMLPTAPVPDAIGSIGGDRSGGGRARPQAAGSSGLEGARPQASGAPGLDLKKMQASGTSGLDTAKSQASAVAGLYDGQLPGPTRFDWMGPQASASHGGNGQEWPRAVEATGRHGPSDGAEGWMPEEVGGAMAGGQEGQGADREAEQAQGGAPARPSIMDTRGELEENLRWAQRIADSRRNQGRSGAQGQSAIQGQQSGGTGQAAEPSLALSTSSSSSSPSSSSSSSSSSPSATGNGRSSPSRPSPSTRETTTTSPAAATPETPPASSTLSSAQDGTSPSSSSDWEGSSSSWWSEEDLESIADMLLTARRDAAAAGEAESPLWFGLDDVLHPQDKSSVYMEDIERIEEDDDILEVVPPPPLPEAEVRFREDVERLLYSLKDSLPGPLHVSAGGDDVDVFKLGLFRDDVKYQDPLVSLTSAASYQQYLAALGAAGARMDLDTIYYTRQVAFPDTRWVHTSWTVTVSLPAISPPATPSASADAALPPPLPQEQAGQGDRPSTRKAAKGKGAGFRTEAGSRAAKKAGGGAPPLAPELTFTGDTVYEMGREGKVSAILAHWTNATVAGQDASVEDVVKLLAPMVDK
eukprot:jgi/Mesvir1/3142/Mv16312-RA.3